MAELAATAANEHIKSIDVIAEGRGYKITDTITVAQANVGTGANADVVITLNANMKFDTLLSLVRLDSSS